jgi:3-deoxy-D-manno-octulosonate 8-phosphate phosphatase (KDO 8-P phosphatase)
MRHPLTPAFEFSDTVKHCAKTIKLVLFDVDGVLTDGRLILGDDGQEYKAFYSQDGHGIKMLQRHGVITGVITGRTSEVVRHRVKNLNIEHVFQGHEEKYPVYRQLIKDLKFNPEQTCFVGDDVVDLPIMLDVGLAIAVANAHPIVKQHAHWVTSKSGGQGAAREVCELIMYAQGTYGKAMENYLSTVSAKSET